MRRGFASVGFVILLSGWSFGQPAAKSPVFEAADVHVIGAGLYKTYRSDSLMHAAIVGDRMELHTASMADLITMAYGLESGANEQPNAERLFGGPTWLQNDRFEVIAKAPPNSSRADLRLMLQGLLADRFKLVVHKADQPIDVFALSQGKKILLKESARSGEPGCDWVKPSGPSSYIEVNCHNVKMADFTEIFRRWAWSYIKHPMVDLTGLKGSYDFSLKWTRWFDGPPMDDPDPYISFFDAIDKQLGLKLEAAKHPMPGIFIDSVNRTPTKNAANVAEVLGVADEFEVASVKPSRPDDRIRNAIKSDPGGRLTIENMPLKTLIALAWNMEHEEKLVVDGPKWIDSANFDLVAKAGGSPSPQPLPMEDYQPMLQAMLKDRFKLKVHTEDRLIPVWSLVQWKRGPNLKEGDPTGYVGCLWQPGEKRSGTFAISTLILECRNVSMAQFADTLHATARIAVDHPAVDNTGLKGVYNFTIEWSGLPAVQAVRNRNQGTDGQASTPIDAMTLYEALEKIGLHLETGQKHMEPNLVIDHIEPLVGDN